MARVRDTRRALQVEQPRASLPSPRWPHQGQVSVSEGRNLGATEGSGFRVTKLLVAELEFKARSRGPKPKMLVLTLRLTVRFLISSSPSAPSVGKCPLCLPAILLIPAEPFAHPRWPALSSFRDAACSLSVVLEEFSLLGVPRIAVRLSDHSCGPVPLSGSPP